MAPPNAVPSFGFDCELLSFSPAQAVEFRAAIISESPQQEEIQPSSSIRWGAGKSEPGLTTKVPGISPCNTNVPCKNAVGSGLKIHLLSVFYRNDNPLHIECQ